MAYQQAGLGQNPNAGEAPAPYVGQAINDSIESIWLGYTSAWNDWTPTYTDLTIGNGSVISRYYDLQGRMHFSWSLVLGSTSAVGNQPRISNWLGQIGGSQVSEWFGGVAAYYDDTASKWWPGALQSLGTGGSLTGSVRVSAETATPFTWSTSDILVAQWSVRVPQQTQRPRR